MRLEKFSATCQRQSVLWRKGGPASGWKIKTVGIFLGIFLFPILGLFNDVNAAATLYFSASTTKVSVGGTFTVYPRVNTGGEATNAYTVHMVFPSDLVQPISISKGGSICTLYTQEPSYTASTASISCGLPTPGYNGSNGGLGSITFRAKAVGTATITIRSNSKVLANDGLGTNILSVGGSISINITEPPPPPIVAPTVSCSVGASDQWIAVQDVTFSWTVPSNSKGFSYILTQDQNIAVSKSNMGSGTSKSYTGLADGVYYFKIAATDGSQWSNTTTYVLLIDTTPPENIEITSDPPNKDEIDKLPMISFNATDAASGVDHYEIKIDDGEYIVTTNPYQITEISSGEHTITVKAVDMAGNFAEGSIVLKIAIIPAPIITKPKDGSYIPIGEKIKIEGTSTPNSIVYIYLNGELIGEVTSDSEGNFIFTYDQILMKGDYEIYAVSKNEGGIISQKSSTVKFSIDPYAIKLFGFVIPSFCVAIALIVLFILLILLLIYIYKKLRDYRERIRNNLRKAQKRIDKEFDELERDVRNEIEETLSQEKRQKVSKAIEHELERDLTKEILETEKDVQEEIEKVPYRKNQPQKKKSKEGKRKDLERR